MQWFDGDSYVDMALWRKILPCRLVDNNENTDAACGGCDQIVAQTDEKGKEVNDCIGHLILRK